MKKLIRKLTIKGLTFGQTAKVWYFGMSLCLTVSAADSQPWALLLLFANLSVSVYLLSRVPVPESWKK